MPSSHTLRFVAGEEQTLSVRFTNIQTQYIYQLLIMFSNLVSVFLFLFYITGSYSGKEEYKMYSLPEMYCKIYCFPKNTEVKEFHG